MSRERYVVTRGPAVVVAGKEWRLACPPPGTPFDAIRDRLVDQNILRDAYQARDVQHAAAQLLRLNYTLSPREAAYLAGEASMTDPDRLRDAVERATFFKVDARNRYYTAWVASALLSAGIDPWTTPSHLIGPILAHLERSGRIVPWSEFSQAEEARARLSSIMARVEEQEHGGE